MPNAYVDMALPIQMLNSPIFASLYVGCASTKFTAAIMSFASSGPHVLQDLTFSKRGQRFILVVVIVKIN